MQCHNELLPRLHSGEKTLFALPIDRQPPIDDMHQSVDKPDGNFDFWTWWAGSYTITIYHSAKPPYSIGDKIVMSNVEVEITDIKAIQLQDINEEIAIQFGCSAISCDHKYRACEEIDCCGPTALGQFKAIWNQTSEMAFTPELWVWLFNFKKI